MIVPDHVEVYVDDAAAPAQVLTAPPFRLALDTATLADGEHTLRVVTRFADGRRLDRRIGIVVRNHPEPLPYAVLEGLADGDRVAGVIRATLSVGPAADGRRAGLSLVVYPLAVAAVLAGVWAAFALTTLPSPPASTSGSSTGTGPASAPAGPAAGSPSGGGGRISAGAQQFQIQGCDGCHSAAGAGGTVGPDLTHVGARLSRAQMEATITHGGGAMPAFASMDRADLNVLLDYLQSLK